MTPPPKSYPSAQAFRRALEDRLIHMAGREKVDVQRLRREVSFDRFLTRLFVDDRAPWVLKGGYAMELRIKEARATRDIDLTIRQALPGGADNLLEALQEAASQDLNDFFAFTVGAPIRDLDAAPYGGARYPVEALMDGRSFAKFHLDVGIGDVVLEPLDRTIGRDWLGFAGIPAVGFPTISQEQQFAEKLHAYTQPRQRPNSRVRDIVDMILLIRTGKMDPAVVRKSVRATFDRRKTHLPPVKLNPPPPAWVEPFSSLARECKLSEDLGQAFEVLMEYFSAVVANS